MNRNRLVAWQFILLAAVGVVLVLLFWIPYMQTSGQVVDALNQRLNEIGIQSVEATIRSREPVELTVTLHQNEQRVSREELWHFHLVIREVELLHLIGYPIHSYKTIIKQGDGKVISEGITYLHPTDRSQQVRPVGPAAIGDHETEGVISELVHADFDRLPLPTELRLEAVESTTGHEVRDDTKVVIVRIGVPSREVVNSYFRELGLLGGAICAKVNNTYGAQIAVLRLQVLDEHDAVVGEYIHDYEIGGERWWFAEGIDVPWSAPPSSVVSPLATPTAPTFISPLSTPIGKPGS